MLNDATLQYCKQLIETMRVDYPYYLLYTNTNVNNTSTYDAPTCFIVFSNKKITANSRYNYTVVNPIVYTIKNSNASYSYHSERISIDNFNTSKTYSINNYEFVYTNAEFSGYSVQPDITANNSIKNYEWQGFSFLLAVIVVSVIFYKLIKK